MRIRRYQPKGGGVGFAVDLGEIVIGAASDDGASALHAATGLASDLVKAAENHPEMVALLPPQARAALMALKVASWAAKNDRVQEVVREFPGAVNTVMRLLKGL